MQVSKRLIVLGIFGLLALPLMGVASAQNLLPNGYFETGNLDGWQLFQVGPNSSITVVTGEQDDNSSQPGLYSAFMDNQDEALGQTLKGQTPAGSAFGGGTAYYSFDLKLGEQGIGAVFFVEIWAEQENGGIVGGSGLLGSYAPTGWTYFQGSFPAPANTDFLTIEFRCTTGAVVGEVSTMYVDNVFLGLVEPPVATEEMTMGAVKALYR